MYYNEFESVINKKKYINVFVIIPTQSISGKAYLDLDIIGCYNR